MTGADGRMVLSCLPKAVLPCVSEDMLRVHFPSHVTGDELSFEFLAAIPFVRQGVEIPSVCVCVCVCAKESITSRHVTSRRVTSRRVASCHVTSRYVTSCHVTSRCVAARHVTSSRYVTSRHVTSRCVTSSRPVPSRHVTDVQSILPSHRHRMRLIRSNSQAAHTFYLIRSSLSALSLSLSLSLYLSIYIHICLVVVF
jgi:hypothetical protein